MQDLETHPHLVLTNEMEWDPHNINMQRKPDKWLEQNAAFLNAMSRGPHNNDPHSDVDLLTREINSLSMSEQTLAERAVKSVKVHANGVVSKHRHSKHTPEHISKFLKET